MEGRVGTSPTQPMDLQDSSVADNIAHCTSKEEAKTYDNSNNDMSLDVEYHPLRRHTRGSLTSIRLSLFNYRMVERGSKIESYDNHSMAHMIVGAIRCNMPRAKEHDMCVDEQGSLTTNDIQFSTQHQDEHK